MADKGTNQDSSILTRDAFFLPSICGWIICFSQLFSDVVPRTAENTFARYAPCDGDKEYMEMGSKSGAFLNGKTSLHIGAG